MKYDQPDDIWDGIIPCPDHPVETPETGCGHCDAELSARSARIDQMHASAADILTDIVRNGGPQLPPHVLMEQRLELLIDSILTDPKMRLKYEGEVGRRMMLGIKDMQAKTKQPTLHIPKGNVRPIR